MRQNAPVAVIETKPATSGYMVKTAKSGPLRAVTTETGHDKSTPVQADHLLEHAMSRWQRLDFLYF